MKDQSTSYATPRRHDARPGSFKINVFTGRWADFASGDKGGDPISLLAYLTNSRQIDAARDLADQIVQGESR